MIRSLLLFSLLLHSTVAQKPAGPLQPVAHVKKWSTLSGWYPLNLYFSKFIFLWLSFKRNSSGVCRLSGSHKDREISLCSCAQRKKKHYFFDIVHHIDSLSHFSGNEPIVIARGGFSGLFPEGTQDAIGLSQDISIFLCNLQLTKDGGAFCVTGATLDNATTIAMFDPKQKTYNINGRNVQGHFSTDYTGAQIDQNVSSESYINLHFVLRKLCHTKLNKL